MISPLQLLFSLTLLFNSLTSSGAQFVARPLFPPAAYERVSPTTGQVVEVCYPGVVGHYPPVCCPTDNPFHPYRCRVRVPENNNNGALAAALFLQNGGKLSGGSSGGSHEAD
jgi:hypothetical protein